MPPDIASLLDASANKTPRAAYTQERQKKDGEEGERERDDLDLFSSKFIRPSVSPLDEILNRDLRSEYRLIE